LRKADAISLAVDHVHLQETLDAVEPLQNQLVASVKFDARFTVDTFSTEFRTQLALRLGPVATGLSRSANLTGYRCPATGIIDPDISVAPLEGIGPLVARRLWWDAICGEIVR
jgi:hypothetical protein